MIFWHLAGSNLTQGDRHGSGCVSPRNFLLKLEGQLDQVLSGIFRTQVRYLVFVQWSGLRLTGYLGSGGLGPLENMCSQLAG